MPEQQVVRVEYLVEDVDDAMSTADINTLCNQRGGAGWKLVHVGSVVRHSADPAHGYTQVRLWWLR